MLDNIRLPAWFEKHTGFAWLDEGGDVWILLGHAGHRSTESLGSVTMHINNERHTHSISETIFHEPAWLAVMCYKGEMSIQRLQSSDHDQNWWDKCKPLPPDERHPAGLLMLTGRYTREWRT